MLVDFSQIMYSINPEELKSKDSKADLCYIKNFAKLFDSLENNFQKITEIANKWLFSATWLVKEKEFNEKKSYYEHYRAKNLKLVKEIEEIRKKKKVVPQKKLLRLERVRFVLTLEYR